jgi:glutamine cyclotransferase
MTIARGTLTMCAALVVAACGDRAPAPFDIVARYPHDQRAYTQGLLRVDSVLFESTGQYGHSEIRRVDLKSGKVLASRPLAANRFGEGLALVKDKLYQITWKENVAYTYDAATLAPRDSFSYPGEGWGLATDGTVLFMSDGSDSLRVLTPETFKVQRVVHVKYNGGPLYKLNEMEYVGGELLANVYESNWIVRIDPSSGEVHSVIDFADLFPNRPPPAEVMNGIAIARDSGQLLVTGKLWPTVFQIRLRPPTP